MAKNKTMAYMVDPTMAAAGIQAQAAPVSQPQAFSYDVPVQANMMGGAKPVFNQQAQGMAQTAFWHTCNETSFCRSSVSK